MKINCTYTDLVELHKITPNPKNNNRHNPEQIERLAKIIDFQGQRRPLIVSKTSGFLNCGHCTLEAIKLLGWKECAVDYQEFESEAAEYANMTADNELARWAELDKHMMLNEIESGLDLDLDLLGIEDLVLPNLDGEIVENLTLSDKFIAPPMSILDTRQGYWLDRNRFWKGLNIKSEMGRSVNKNTQISDLDDEFKTGFTAVAPETSIFDPTLAEIINIWFSPIGGIVIDCFAGGSVRGVVASLVGRKYIGVELRPEQVEANRAQENICNQDNMPVWHCGDSVNIDKICSGVGADLLFSCPPYADLEVYSDIEGDISNMGYDDFIVAYRKIIKNSCSLLKNDSFACFVVGEVRDNKGKYRNFVGDTIGAFIDSGLHYYNEIVLVNQVGTGAMRANKQFSSSRKAVKVHQNVLVFVKGDPKKATEKCGEVEVLLENFT